MPVIFEKNTGRVVSVPDRVASGTIRLVHVDGSGGPLSFRQHRTIITRLGMSVAGNYQFLHTIGNEVYVYVFGDRMGQITIHGLSFSSECPERNEDEHGFEKLYRWYQANRIASRRAPLSVTIGRSTAFEGFLVSLASDMQDQLQRTIQFQMTLAMLPDTRRA